MFRRIFPKLTNHLKRSTPLLRLPKKLFSTELKAGDSTTFKEASVYLGSSLLTGLAFYAVWKEFTKDVSELLPESIPPALEKARVTSSHSKAKYVSRPGLEAKINNFLDSNSTSYCVVYGAKGVGKSEVVDHTAIGKRAVVKVPVTTIGTRDDLVALIMSKLTGKKISLDIDKLIDVLKKCKTDGFVPTIIFDVERAYSPDRPLVLQDVRSLAKALIGYCRCIIVLSEANAVLEFGKDDDREEFIFVDEMTELEAREFLKVRGATFSDEEMRYIFDTIGTSPVTLIDLMSKISVYQKTLKDYVDAVLGGAHQDLLAFPLQPILQALKEHPEGVSPDYFNKQKYEGIDMSNPGAVGSAMKTSNAIIYRIELRKYQLMSAAHKTALKTYTPIINNNSFSTTK